MFNKLIYTLVILAFSGTLLTAQTRQTKQTQGKRKKVKTEQIAENSEKSGKTDLQKEIRMWSRRDPRLADPNAGEAKRILDQIRKDFVEREFPRKMQNYKAGSGSSLLLQVKANAYKRSLSNPDLEEATGIRLSWYNEAGAAFVALYHSLDEIERAISLEQEKRYVTAAVKYMKLAKILENILDKPEKIPSGELDKIKETNTERRKLENRKRINELMRQRRAGR